MANTLKDVEITLIEDPKAPASGYIVTRLNEKPVAATDLVKVAKRGMFWLLGEDGAEYAQQEKRPSKIEFEKILCEVSLSGAVNNYGEDSGIISFGGAVAQFGPAILPGQVIKAPMVSYNYFFHFHNWLNFPLYSYFIGSSH